MGANLLYGEEYSGALDVEQLLHYKRLDPVAPECFAELTRIKDLDISSFSEADVREEIISPLIKILGYSKGGVFSLDREKHIKFLNKNLFIDYNLTLWSENFWLIEAKKPNERRRHFQQRDLSQALEYASHPEINAALIVLWDGHKIEIFDREVSVSDPILSLLREDLIDKFDKIRILLDPWQMWFFQKRRVIRLLDKVFDQEFNLSRVDEFRNLIDRRLTSKRSIVLDNFRSRISSQDDISAHLQYLRSADVGALIDVHFYLTDTEAALNTIVDTLILHSERDLFNIMIKIFPDHPRDANGNFWGHALLFLMKLGRRREVANWVPGWLSGPDKRDRNIHNAIKILIGLTLTHFRDDEPRATILRYSASARRLYKGLFTVRSDFWRYGEMLHALGRYQDAETSWQQIISTPGTQILHQINSLEIIANANFVKDCRDEQGRFLATIGKNKLRDSWETEVKILGFESIYRELAKERNIGEIHPTEWDSVSYDHLGHLSLCLLEKFPEWKQYTLEHHIDDINVLAACGSWQARRWLGGDTSPETKHPHADKKLLADRFFFGHANYVDALEKLYSI